MKREAEGTLKYTRYQFLNWPSSICNLTQRSELTRSLLKVVPDSVFSSINIMGLFSDTHEMSILWEAVICYNKLTSYLAHFTHTNTILCGV